MAAGSTYILSSYGFTCLVEISFANRYQFSDIIKLNRRLHGHYFESFNDVIITPGWSQLDEIW